MPEAAFQPTAKGDATVLSPEDTTDLAGPDLPVAENDLSRRYLRIIERWIPVGVEYFAEWPQRPNCGHFFGGAHWYGAESAGPAETFALASVSPEYDAGATGISRRELQQMALMAVRYLCFTHDTGPEDCVRPAEGLGRAENCGTKWGQRGEGFFRESQCGSTVAAIARVCLLLRDQVDDETWMMVARIHEDYAARFGDMAPKSGVYLDTQMEENAWTAFGLASCYLFLSGHERAGDWEANARRWMFSACTAPQDARDFGRVGESTAAALTGKTFTALPDYWAENHGMVHPSYTASGLIFMMAVGCQLGLWGRDLPPELWWNRRRIYENLKAVTDGAGYPQAIQGMDWHYLPTAGAETPHAIASVFFDDPDAAALQRVGLRNCELRQEGNDGRLYDRDLAERAHDQQDPMIMREINIQSAAHLYLLHRLFGPGAEPTPPDELEKRLQGVRLFPHAGFVHHRHTRGQTSLSWRNSIMALPLTREGIYTIAPATDSWLGRPVVRERPDSHRLVSARITEHDDAFAGVLVIDRCQESLRQQVLLASLPDGRMLSWERFVALEAIVLAGLEQGFLRLTNETFPLLGSCSRGVRRLYTPDGARDYHGWLGESEDDDVVDMLGRPGWLNLDDRIGIVFAGPGEAIYHNRHHHRPYRAIADDVVLSRLEGPQELAAGEASEPLTALLIPEQPHEETGHSRLRVLDAPPDIVGMLTGDYLVAANFGDRERDVTLDDPGAESSWTFTGATAEVLADRVRYSLTLPARSAHLLRSRRAAGKD